MIRDGRAADSGQIAAIYNHYIDNSIATFEENALDPADMEGRMAEVAEAGLPWLVAARGDSIEGYAYASRWNGRCAYRFSVETTVYLAPDCTGRGVGATLYEALFDELRERGFHVAIAGISLPNPASIALHEKFGMEKVAHFSEVGYKYGGWIDVGYWQVTLDGAREVAR